MAKAPPFTDISIKMRALSVNRLLKKCRLRTKWSKNPALSVNPHHNCQKFTDKSLKIPCLSVKCVLLTDKSSKIGALSVKCVLLTDKSSKIGALSVNLNEILTRLVMHHCIYQKRPADLQACFLKYLFCLIQRSFRVSCKRSTRQYS